MLSKMEYRKCKTRELKVLSDRVWACNIGVLSLYVPAGVKEIMSLSDKVILLYNEYWEITEPITRTEDVNMNLETEEVIKANLL